MDNFSLNKIIPIFYFLLKILSLTLFFAFSSFGRDTISQGLGLKDGETLISAGGLFELGFFSPANSSSRYVGIWYYNISVQTVIWVANRNSPVSGKNGFFTIENDRNLRVLDGERIVWVSNSTHSRNNYTAVLQDDGNFVIKPNHCSDSDIDISVNCWRTFDHPTDTFLPSMRVNFNQLKGEVKIYNSWKSESDPSIGNYSMGVDPRASPQVVIWEGLNRIWRSGIWDGVKFNGVPNMSVSFLFGFKLSNVDEQGNVYFSYSPPTSVPSPFRFRITWDGFEKSQFWVHGGNEWKILQSEPSGRCAKYNECGAYGYCSTEGNNICNCFQGFEPKYQNQWDGGNWSGGCVRKTSLQCEENNTLIGEDKFLQVDGLKLPDFADRLGGVDEPSCQKTCLENCSCKAYTYLTSIGCMMWGGELTDIQQFSQEGNTLYIRIAPSDLDSRGNLSSPKIAAIVLSILLVLCIILFFLWKFVTKSKVSKTARRNNEGLAIQIQKNKGYSTDVSGMSEEIPKDQSLVKTPDVPMLNYYLVASSTDFFSEENKLGQGGFGPVYKGKLSGGEEIAVKKLSRKSGQGMEEFKNEIMLIAKLQHRNLVRILGFSMDGEEKLLVYEYMPEKSLDGFIFDLEKQEQLDWKKRFAIIEGVARGLLYLHRDARCKIIHRDLKASNILLDKDLNPKISDFGMARIFGGDQDHMNTNRVVGTYGYMSPEYAMEGLFSEKSDVYSFGVLMLEIITGRRNSSFRSSEHITLVEYAWQIWKEGKTGELINPSIRNSSPSNEVSRCVHIAMLCVQDYAVHRPVMSQVVLWLGSDSLALPCPQEPTLTFSSSKSSIEIGSLNDVGSSGNLTTSTMVPR